MSNPTTDEVSSSTNPYSPAPIDTPLTRPIAVLSWNLIGRMLATVAICAFVGAAVGAGVGVVIGTIAPGYYGSMFSSEADPVSLGLSLGLTQGLGGGAAIGVALVAIGCWYLSRCHRRA